MFLLKNIIFNLFGLNAKLDDLYKDVNNKGLSQRFNAIEHYTIVDIQLVNVAFQLFQSTLFNTGKSGRPYP